MDSPAASDNVFTHEPLPDPATYMRLLEVLDDNYSQTTKVRCRLTTWPIDSMPPYHAISYTWGDPKSNTLILMNDKTLEVRTNCEFALKQAYWYRRSHSYLYKKRRSRLWYENKSKWYTKSQYFWLDALCIDQSNLNEKSKQVAMMGDIYRNASHVLSCIGDHADDSLFFFESLYGLAHYLIRPKNVLRYHRYGEVGISFRFRLLHQHSSIHRFVLALARLAVRPYFTRIWILQELQLAKHLTILCGQHVLTKNDILYLLSGLLADLKRLADDEANKSSTLWTPHLRFLSHRFLRRHVNHGFPHPVWHGSWLTALPKPCMATIAMLSQDYRYVDCNIFQLLNEVVSRLQCQDPRDKAYGIISLIQWGDVAPLQPDYTQNDLEVAVKFIEAIVKLGEAKKLTEPSIYKFVILVVKLFNINIESPGLVEALKARRQSDKDSAMEDDSKEDVIMDRDGEMDAVMRALKGPKIKISANGWCLLPEDIDRNMSKLRDLHATPPQYDENDALYLPSWARAGDWVIELGTQMSHDLWYDHSDAQYQLEPTYIPLLVVGKGIEGQRKARSGYGFYSPLKQFHTPGFKLDKCAEVYVFFGIQDSVIFLSNMKRLYEMRLESKDWMVELLDTNVSNQQTGAPGSTYFMLPSEPPERTKRVEPKVEDSRFWRCSDALAGLRNKHFVLFDTKTRRGWFVNGQVVALELLCAYLKNTPQTEPFDMSKLNYIEDKSSRKAYKVLGDMKNLEKPIFKVLKDVERAAGEGQTFQRQAKVETRLIVDVLKEIYQALSRLDPLRPLPGDMDHFDLFHMPSKRNGRNVIAKGWEFEGIYRTGKAKAHAHLFEKDPGWLSFVRDARAGIIFGSDFGDMILPRDQDCCPYFKILPKGQDYLAMGMDRVQGLVDYWTQMDDKDKVVARLSDWYAWERGLEPFGHSHGQGEHLEQIDCSCFPVQRLVKVPHFDSPEKDMALLKKRRRQLYSSREVEDMNVTSLAGVDKLPDDGESRFHDNVKLRKKGVVVFGNRPDPVKLKQLAKANESEVKFRGTAEDRRNSHCTEVSVASQLVRSSRLMRASDSRWARWTGKEYSYNALSIQPFDSPSRW